LTPGQLWQVPVFVVGLLVFLAVAACTPIRRPPEWWRFDATVAALRQGLQQDADPNKLVAYAETALLQVHRFGDRAAEVHFLAGSAYYRQALANPPRLTRDLWPRVAEHLEQALQLGADDADMAPLQYRLGRALLAQGRDVPRALELMARSIDQGAEHPLAGYRLLAQAYLKLPVPDVDAALKASRKVIELSDDRDVETLAQARFAHAELLLRTEQRAEVIRELDWIGANVSPALRSKARLLQVRCCEQEGMWEKALVLWKNLLPDAALVPGGKARVQYGIGWCSAQLEKPDNAGAARAWQEALRLGGLEGQAAGLRLGGLLLFGPNPDAARGLEDWRTALSGVQTTADYHNPYVTLEEARTLFDQALAMFGDTQDYEQMRAVAELLRKLAPSGEADEKVAQAAEGQAKKLQAEAEPPVEEVRTCYRVAGEAYEQAATARPDRQRFDVLWRSARCFLDAQEADRAAAVLAQLDRLDQEDARLAEGWFLLAEAQRARGQPEKARPAYLRSMQYAATPFAAHARYQLAVEEIARKNWKEAEEILRPNLDGSNVDHLAHQKSLYQMALVQLNKQDMGRALVYLGKAIEIYPNNPMALVVRGQLAECYRRLADQAWRKEEEHRQTALNTALTDSQKQEIEELIRHQRNARRELLHRAADVYRALADDLADRQRERPLTNLEGTVARRALLGIAECHQEQGEFLDALRLYQDLLQRHRSKIETLIACERIVKLEELDARFDVLSRQGKQEVQSAARSALGLVHADLLQMDPRAPDFQGEGVWTWQRWQEWITAEQKRLGSPSS
jgi:tetratricopeptide (TPR) repeat protein